MLKLNYSSWPWIFHVLNNLIFSQEFDKKKIIDSSHILAIILCTAIFILWLFKHDFNSLFLVYLLKRQLLLVL